MTAGDDKCCTTYVSVSQMTGLNRGNSVHWYLWTRPLPESKGKGRGKYCAQVRLRAIICPKSRAQEEHKLMKLVVFSLSFENRTDIKL